MSPKKFNYVMIGIVALLAVLAVVGVVMGSNMLTKKSAKLAELKLENKVLEEQKTDLIAAKASIEQYKELEKIAKQIVPQDKDQARAVREIVKIGNTAGINISSVSFPSSSLGGSAAPTTGSSGGSGSSGSSGSSGGSSSSSSAAKLPAISQAIPVPSIKGLYQLDVSVQISEGVTYPKLLNFLQLLEANRRTAHVNSLVITPNSANRDLLSVNMTMKVYLKP